jgi:hypothetical protein
MLECPAKVRRIIKNIIIARKSENKLETILECLGYVRINYKAY